MLELIFGIGFILVCIISIIQNYLLSELKFNNKSLDRTFRYIRDKYDIATIVIHDLDTQVSIDKHEMESLLENHIICPRCYYCGRNAGKSAVMDEHGAYTCKTCAGELKCAKK